MNHSCHEKDCISSRFCSTDTKLNNPIELAEISQASSCMLFPPKQQEAVGRCIGGYMEGCDVPDSDSSQLTQAQDYSFVGAKMHARSI